MTTQTEQVKTSEPDFDVPRVDSAIFYLLKKAADHLSEDELKWFAGFSDKVEEEANDLADALVQLYCISDNYSLDNMRAVLLSLSHHAYAITGMAGISSIAINRLLNPELFVKGGAA